MSWWCEYCNVLLIIECFCGWDICICKNNGERICPKCAGETTVDTEEKDGK